MSVIPQSPGISEEKFAGTYHITASPNSNYLIVSLEAKTNSASEYSPLSITGGTPLSNSGVLNNGKYNGEITSDSFSVGTSNVSESIKINSLPKRFAVVYHQNHSGSDNNVYRTYFNVNTLDDRSGAKQPASDGTNTYTFSSTAVTFASTGFTAPTNKHFTGWNTSSSGSGEPYAEGTSVTSNVTDIDLYAQYSDDSQYTIDIYFDSNEITGSNIDIV